MAMQRFETHGEYASNFVKSFKKYQKALRITWWLEYFLPIGLGTTSIALILWHVIHRPYCMALAQSIRALATPC